MYWGEHKPGMSCPCGPIEQGTWSPQDGFKAFIQHQQIREPIEGEHFEELKRIFNKKMFGQENVTYGD